MFFARCLLFTPANHPERFLKAHELGSDGVIIDLEDAISLEDKKYRGQDHFATSCRKMVLTPIVLSQPASFNAESWSSMF